MAATSRSLTATAITAAQVGLQAALDAPSGLDDGARVDAMRALEVLVCTATAAQAALARELDASMRGAQAAAGVPAAKRGVGVAAQVALARRVSPHRGQRHLGLAKITATELPHTWAAWRAGRITEWKATLIARETACLSVEHRLEIDRLVAADADAVEEMSDGRLAGACAAHAARLDAAAVTQRRRRAESQRHVSLRPAPDTMTYLTALLPVKDGVAVHAVLRLAADAARAMGDERSRGQVMADTLVDAVLAAGGRAREAETTWDHQPPSSSLPQGHRPASATGVVVNLVMSEHTLFGTAEDPAHLQGFGPIPAELAREIITGACTSSEQVWLRRLYASPTTGELVSMDARTRLFRGSLAKFIHLRDQTCRTPWCEAPIRHLDHATRSAEDGPTAASNAQGLCEACNHAKEAPHWRTRSHPDASITTTLPTGHSYTTRPPPVATIRHSTMPPLRIDYILTG